MVDEGEQVVVAGEGEDLVTLVDEAGGELVGEVVVVGIRFVAEALAVDGEELGVVVGEDPAPGLLQIDGQSPFSSGR